MPDLLAGAATRSASIVGRFDAVVRRDDVACGKPHLDLYLRAAQLLGRRPERRRTLEDSYIGIRAAHSAGIPVIMVPDLLPETAKIRDKCLLVAPDLHKVRHLFQLPARTLSRLAAGNTPPGFRW
jgi:beta-phosphoglucomutase-like phosphatase (HAD superfamily)